MEMMRILKDGVFHTKGDLADEIARELKTDPTFDPGRLQYDPDDLKTDANLRAAGFAAKARHLIVNEPDALRRDGWTMKGVLAAMILMRESPATFDQIFIPAVRDAFEGEATRRGLDETADELMLESARKMLAMLFATNLVEGNLRGLQKAISVANPADIDSILSAAMERAEEDMALLQTQPGA